MKQNNYLGIALAIVLSSIILAFGMTQIKKQYNYVTVKGLSEREVFADQAWWSINAQYGANTVDAIQSKVVMIQTTIHDFLKEQGFSEGEINVENINIYQNNYQGALTRLNADVRISVTTPEIRKVKQAVKASGVLLEKGILIQSDKWASGPKYYFTQFKDIKKEMLAEATVAAKEAAQEFAKNSGSKVGTIRRANQGIFQILPANKTQDNQEFYDKKIIRVVSTFDYYLK
ncbi:MAG: SIMPL domain-containing protein [Saprospiraceae bacterium]|nr:SIMPL domain-containing protein [Saprospiraceae bacterium]